MKNLKNIEKLMMLPSRSTESELATAYDNMVNVFRFKDKKEHTNHCNIFKMLYEVKTRRYTYIRIASMVGASDNALRRYRAEYAAWFCYYLELERNKRVVG